MNSALYKPMRRVHISIFTSFYTKPFILYKRPIRTEYLVIRSINMKKFIYLKHIQIENDEDYSSKPSMNRKLSNTVG